MAAEWMSERQSPQAVHVNKNYVCPHQKNAKNICRIKNVFYLCNPKRKDHKVLENIGAVVQLVRIRACHARGRGFESRPHRQ